MTSYSEILRKKDVLVRTLTKLGFEVHSRESRSSNSNYLEVTHHKLNNGDDENWITIRISDHKQVYDADYSVDPSEFGVGIFLLCAFCCCNLLYLSKSQKGGKIMPDRKILNESRGTFVPSPNPPEPPMPTSIIKQLTVATPPDTTTPTTVTTTEAAV